MNNSDLPPEGVLYMVVVLPDGGNHPVVGPYILVLLPFEVSYTDILVGFGPLVGDPYNRGCSLNK